MPASRALAEGNIACQCNLIRAGILRVVVIGARRVVVVIVGHLLLGKLPGTDSERVVAGRQVVEVDIGVLDMRVAVVAGPVCGTPA